MKILEFHAKKIKYLLENHENPENYIIPIENHKNHEHLRIPREDNENHETKKKNQIKTNGNIINPRIL